MSAKEIKGTSGREKQKLEKYTQKKSQRGKNPDKNERKKKRRKRLPGQHVGIPSCIPAPLTTSLSLPIGRCVLQHPGAPRHMGGGEQTPYNSPANDAPPVLEQTHARRSPRRAPAQPGEVRSAPSSVPTTARNLRQRVGRHALPSRHASSRPWQASPRRSRTVSKPWTRERSDREITHDAVPGTASVSWTARVSSGYISWGST